jgi:DNA-binding response OmpR family regulator
VTEGMAKDYIVKPFATDDFLKKINTALMDKTDKKARKALGEEDKK